MPESDLVGRYMRLVKRFERLEAQKKVLWDEMQTMMEAMTSAEAERLGDKLRDGHEAARESLQVHIRQLRSAPVE